jgi:hypothetical protein
MSLVLAGDGVSVNPFNGRPAWLTLGGFWIIKQNIFFLKFRNPIRVEYEREKPLLFNRHKVVRFLISPKKRKVKIEVNKIMMKN